MSDIMAITYEDAVPVQLNPTNGKDPNGPFAALQSTAGAGTASIVTARGRTTTIYLPLGQIMNVACKGVISVSGASSVVGLIAVPYAGGQQ